MTWQLYGVTAGGDGPGRHLVGEEHHDGVEPGARWRVLDREGVVVVLDDVEVDVGLQRPHHARRALDPNADVTCGGWHRARGRVTRGVAAGAGMGMGCWDRDEGAGTEVIDQA